MVNFLLPLTVWVFKKITTKGCEMSAKQLAASCFLTF